MWDYWFPSVETGTVRILRGPQHCEIESTLSAEDNLSIFTRRLIYQRIPNTVQVACTRQTVLSVAAARCLSKIAIVLLIS